VRRPQLKPHVIRNQGAQPPTRWRPLSSACALQRSPTLFSGLQEHLFERAGVAIA
jgi:hypothetical protein